VSLCNPDKEGEKHDGQLAEVSGEIWALGRSEKAKKSTRCHRLVRPGCHLLHAETHSYRPTGHHHPKTKLPIQARLIATSVNKPMMAPRWCVTLALWLTGWFIA
jgi:hypothetical protein